MSQTDLSRDEYLDKYINFSPADQTNLATSDTVVGTFIVPRNMRLKGISVGFLTADATSSALTGKVKSGSTVIASSTATGATTATTSCPSPVDVFVPKCSILTVTMNSGTSTDDFTGIALTVWLEPVKTDS